MRLKGYFFVAVITSLCLPAQADIRTDGSLGPALALPGPVFQIDADLGRQQGANLFHSFATFHIRNGESATFSGPDSVQHVISRVTGGEVSEINGTLRSAMPAADIYLLNPAGLMFGPQARLDVPAGFHAGSADAVVLADGAEFRADAAQTSAFSSAAPAAFGFLDQPHGDITVTGDVEAHWQLEEQQALTLAGGNLYIHAGKLGTAEGTLRLSAVQGSGQVSFTTPPPAVPSGGTLRLSDKALLEVSGNGGGRIYLRAGEFVADDSTVVAKTLGHGKDGLIDVAANNVMLRNGAEFNGNTEGRGAGADIQITATDSILLQGQDDADQATGIYARSGIYEELTADDLGAGGDIRVRARNITLENRSALSVSTYGGGQGGVIEVQATEKFSARAAGDETFLASATYRTGSGGDITIRADSIEFADGAYLHSVVEGSGQGGDIVLEAQNEVVFHGEHAVFGYGTDIYLPTLYEGENAGNAGDLLISAQNIRFTEGAYIQADTLGSGNGGDVILRAADTILFRGETSAGLNSSIFLPTYGEDNGGAGGKILLEAAHIGFENGAYVNAATFGSGDAGGMVLRAQDSIHFAGTSAYGNGAYLSAGVEGGSGQGGDIDLETGTLSLADGAYISATTYSAGQGGDVDIQARDTVALSGTDGQGWGTGIYANASPAQDTTSGDAGQIRIRAANLSLTQGAIIAGNSIALRSSQSGRAGRISLDISGDTVLDGVNPYGENENGFGSGIYVRSTGIDNNAGPGGDLQLNTGTLRITNGAVIKSSTNNQAPGGSVEIDVAGSAYLAGNAEGIVLQPPRLSQQDYLQKFTPVQYNASMSGIYAESVSSTLQAGDSGHIRLSAGELTLANYAQISSASAGGGQAGDIHIDTGSLWLDDSALIVSESRLQNHYQVVDKADFDAQVIAPGTRVEVTDAGNGRAALYISTGSGAMRLQPVDEVSDMGELATVADRYSLMAGDIITVKDAGNGKPQRFIYQVDFEYGLSAWSAIRDDSPFLRLSVEQLAEVRGWYAPGFTPLYPAGTLVEVVENGAVTMQVLATLEEAGYTLLSAYRLSRFNVADEAALETLAQTVLLSLGDLAKVDTPEASPYFVYTGQSWQPFGDEVVTVTNMEEQEAMILVQPGDRLTLQNPAADGVATYVFAGNDWLPQRNTYRVADLAARDVLTPQAGDIAKVAQAADGKAANFFHTGNAWQPQPRGGNAGNIILKVAEGLRLTQGSEISTQAESAGGGKIQAQVGKVTELTAGDITSSVQEGYGNGGDLTLSAEFLVQDRGKVLARAYEGNGGNIFITATGIYQNPMLSPVATGKLIDASSKLGINGTISIQSPAVDISSGLVILSTEFDRAGDLQTSACSAESAAAASHFVEAEYDGVPTHGRGDFLP